METFLKSKAASISSIKYSGVGLKTCNAKTKARDASVWIDVSCQCSTFQSQSALTFSPPDRFAMARQLFLGGMIDKTTPSENGSIESMSSISALPPIVIIFYISAPIFSLDFNRSNPPGTFP